MAGSLQLPRIVAGGALFDAVALVVSVAAFKAVAPVLGVPAAGASAAYLLLPSLLLVVGAFAGRLAERAALPRLTGYIVIGAACGPDLLGVMTADQVASIKVVNNLAIGLIALMAGAEIRLGWLRQRLRAVLVLAGVQSLAIPAVIAVLAVLAGGFFPFLGEAAAAGVAAWLPALLLGVVALANSPMVVVSVIKESRAWGPLSETALGVAILKDVTVILAFSVLVAVIAAQVAGGSGEASAGTLATAGGRSLLHVLGSIALGLPLGWLLSWFSERGEHRLGWLVVGVALVVAVLAPLLHVKPLFCLLAAGFTCENLWPRRSKQATHRLSRALEQVAMPVFIIFFVAAGLGLDLDALRAGWIAVLLLAGTRFAAIWASVRSTSTAAGVEPAVRTWLWAGMVPQAGVALGLAEIIAMEFGGWGTSMKDIIVATVALHELVGPVLFGLALRRASEVGGAAGGG